MFLFFSPVIIVNEENSNSVLDFTSLRLYSVKEKVFEEQKTRNLYLHRDLIVILSRRHHTRVRNSTRGTETSQFQSKMFLNLHFSFIYFFWAIRSYTNHLAEECSEFSSILLNFWICIFTYKELYIPSTFHCFFMIFSLFLYIICFNVLNFYIKILHYINSLMYFFPCISDLCKSLMEAYKKISLFSVKKWRNHRKQIFFCHYSLLAKLLKWRGESSQFFFSYCCFLKELDQSESKNRNNFFFFHCSFLKSLKVK